MSIPRLTTKAACRVAGLDRDRFNEAVARGDYPCAPSTIPGRARLFDPNDMIGLYLFRELMEDGLSSKRAGTIACEVAAAALNYPQANAISYVENYFRGGSGGGAYPADAVPSHDRWDAELFSGTDIRKVTTFRIGKLRQMIAHYTEEERNIIGEDD